MRNDTTDKPYICPSSFLLVLFLLLQSLAYSRPGIQVTPADTQAVCDYCDCLTLARAGNSSDFLKCGVQLLPELKAAGLDSLATVYTINIVISYRLLGKLDSAQYYLKTIDPDILPYNSLSKISYYNEQANIDIMLSRPISAMDNYFKAMSIAERLNDSTVLYVINGNIADIQLDIGNIEKSIETYKLSESYFKTHSPKDYTRILNSIGIAQRRLENYTASLLALEQALTIADTLVYSPAKKAMLFNSMASTYTDMKSYDLALAAIDSSVVYCKEAGITFGLLMNKVQLASIEVQLGNYATAITLLNEVEADTSVQLNESTLFTINELAAISHEALGNKDKALAYIHETLALQEKRENTIRQGLLIDLERIYSEQKLQLEKQALDKALILSRRRNTYMIIISGVMLSMLIISILINRQRNQKSRLLQGIAEEKDKRMSDNMRSKENELAAYTLQVNTLNDALSATKEDLAGLKENVTDKSAQQQIGRIVGRINRLMTEDMWAELQDRFQQTHEGFYKALQKVAAEPLTPVEVKIATLLKLNLSTKDIANLTNRSPKTIDNTRSILRKKLNLDKQDNLVDYLLGLS